MDNQLQKLSNIAELYIKVKNAITLSEGFNNHKVRIAIINELRNALDHIMSATLNPDQKHCDDQLGEAIEHLNRAGYDAYELISINISTRIINSVEKYSSEVISQQFPFYYDEIKPTLEEIQREIANVRSMKKIDPQTKHKNFEDYLPFIDRILHYDKIVIQNINKLEITTKISTMLDAIPTAVRDYDIQIVTQVFPSYYSELLPKIKSIKVGLIDGMLNFEETLVYLTKQECLIQGFIPELENAKTQNNNKKIGRTKYDYIKIFITAILAFISGYILSNFSQENRKGLPPNETNEFIQNADTFKPRGEIFK